MPGCVSSGHVEYIALRPAKSAVAGLRSPEARLGPGPLPHIHTCTCGSGMTPGAGFSKTYPISSHEAATASLTRNVIPAPLCAWERSKRESAGTQARIHECYLCCVCAICRGSICIGSRCMGSLSHKHQCRACRFASGACFRMGALAPCGAGMTPGEIWCVRPPVRFVKPEAGLRAADAKSR